MNNIALIGMPSAGKSTVGVVLAKIIGKKFIDTDLLLQESGKTLPQLIAELGVQKFIELENKTISALSCENTVIATGGSAVYGEDAMRKIKQIATVVYLRAPESELEKRMESFNARGVVTLGAKTVTELCAERAPLYEKYADIVVTLDAKTVDEAAETIKKAIGL